MNIRCCSPAFLVSLLALSGCRGVNTESILLDYPEMVFSTQWVDFGDVPRGDTLQRTLTVQNTGALALGVSAIYEGSGQAGHFAVSWDVDAISCPEVAGEESDTGVVADEKDEDTGGADSAADMDVIALGAGCRLTLNVIFSPSLVGSLYGSIILETTTEELEEDVRREPNYFADLDQTRSVIYLQGQGLRGLGQSVVSPRFVDFGHVWTGLEEKRFVTVENTGDGDLELSAPTLSEACDEAISVSWSYEEGSVLAPEASSLVELTFVPTDQYAAFCTLSIPTNDQDSPEVTVNLQGNSGSDPENEAPTVEIRSPEPGYQHLSGDPLVLEMNIFDVNQPASSLVCRVRSARLQQQTVASCTAPDDSGHVLVDIDLNDSPPGVDTLLVSVSDASDVVAYDSVPILIRAAYPDSDDDGDGYGDSPSGDDEEVDCDDANPDVYPLAAELADGVDNDCDTLVDEGTSNGDDDGDTFTEEEGDCDDASVESYPGGPEIGDHKDNDCDGLVDESTSLFDDDGDGYAEMHNDCDDSDPSVNPGALEVCDGIDNNCNGLMDQQDGCLEIDTSPIIVGGIKMSRSACEEGETLQLSALVHDADGQPVSYTWSAGSEGGSFDDPSAEVVNWLAPELPRESDGALYSVYVVAQDPDGNQVWDFDDITVYPTGLLNGKAYVKVVISDDAGACSTLPLQRMGWMGFAGLGLLLLRRRQD